MCLTRSPAYTRMKKRKTTAAVSAVAGGLAGKANQGQAKNAGRKFDDVEHDLEASDNSSKGSSKLVQGSLDPDVAP